MCRGATPTTITARAIEAGGGHQTHTPQAPHTRCTAHSQKNPDTPKQRLKGTLTTTQGRPTQPGPMGKGQPEGTEHSMGWTQNKTTPHHSTLTTAAKPRREPPAPHCVRVPRAKTAQSIAPKTRTTATNLNRGRSTATTGTMPRGQNHQQRRWPRRQSRLARQRTTHMKHHYPRQVEHPAPRWKPTHKYPPLPKPLTRSRNLYPVALTSLQTTTPWT